MMQRQLSFVSLALVMIAALLLSAVPPIALAEPDAPDATYPYTNNVSYNIPDGTSTTQNGCAYWPATRYFLVNDNFTVNDLNVEFSQSHANRGQIQMKLQAPDGTIQTLIATSNDTSNNYYITIDDASANPMNDGSDDTIGGTRRTVGPSTNGALDAFTGKKAHGHWTMTICDNTYTGGTPSQAFNAATLVFDGTAITPTPLNHQQGPPVVETYFLPWPEDNVWTAMGRIYPTSCSSYDNFRDNYDAAPRQPMVGYTGITIVDAGTVITYDHWEPTNEGYEADLTYPTQNSTEVWGDGDLTNGVAPGDADDLLANGQILILNDVMLSTTLGTIVDFDARDKIGASKPIGVTRSVWSDGSQTMFAAADEVYPVDRWGTQFYSPVGDDADLNGMFEVSMVSIIAANDGTLVDIDKDGDGTYETTGIALSQGQSYFVDDTGDGVDRGARFRSNAGHPIQVNLLAADQCAGYESRTYPLLPYDQWDYNVGLPVSTITTVTGPGNDNAPTTVHLYNPHASTIYVAYNYDTGYAGCLTIAANSSTAEVMTVGEAAHFYNVNQCTAPRTPGTQVFYGVASVDSDNAGGSGDDQNSTYDWGVTLVPEKVMSQWLIVGWAPGDDPTFQGTNAENTAPIWLAGDHAVGSTTPSATYDICVDYNGDCTSGTCTLDPITGRYYDRKATGIAPLQQVKIYKGKIIPPDGTPYEGTAGEDQTGTSIWVCGPDGSDVVITAAWGEDPLVSSPSKPGLDMGYTVRNQRAWRAIKNAALQVDLNGNGLYDEGDTVRYTVTVVNTSGTDIPTVVVTDTFPPNMTYVANSTYLTDDGTPPPYSAQIPDGSPVAFPLDDSGAGYTYSNLNRFSSFKITFDATINPTDPFIPTRKNIAHVTVGTQTVNPEVTITVQNPPVKLGTIGNYVWLDEDGDGDQDAGEAGIPNVLVTLTNGTVTYTTYTDANGGYLFTDLPVGTWTVTVTPPAGLNPTWDENGINTPNVTTVNLTAGEEHLTADFGYNWSTPDQTNDPDAGENATGAIGDRVWVDLDSDGKQDAEEIGIQGVTVQLTNLGVDGILGTADDTTTSTTTDANGNYIFDGLSAGAYVVTVTTPPSGYTQTGDPDHFAVTDTTSQSNDNKTTTPILLGPGDVFVNADFGYVPTTAEVGSIGDTVWVDADRGGDVDEGEPRLPGVTVALIKDVNGNGTWEVGEPIIATDITDANGQYLFSGLPTGDTADYLVWVNDTNNVIGDLVPTYDSNGGAGPTSSSAPTGVASVTVLGISSVQNLTTAGNLAQDFGYAPANHDVGDGLIGDTVFLDVDADGQPDPGEGMEGVTVRLYAADGVTLVGTTTTNENGQYFFGNLPAATYIVQVQTGTLPYAGLSNTVDPDGGNNSTSTVALPAGGVNLTQDFGYRDMTQPNTIGGTIWTDTNADGTMNNGEWAAGTPCTGCFAGVTVVLRDAGGDVVATTVTDANGNYSFTNLPDGTYRVDVTDDNNVLNGYWKSNGTNPGADNNSQVDPYTVSVSGGQTNTTGDFGYYVKPAALGNRVWLDSATGTGTPYVQDPTDTGISGVEVVLTITWPDGSTTVVKTITDANGYYSFGNLLQDEDYAASTTGDPATDGKPKFVVSVDYKKVPYWPTKENYGNNDAIDADRYAGVAGKVSQGQLDTSGIASNPGSESEENAWCDFGFQEGPLAVNLASFSAEAAPEGVTLAWEMVSEIDNAGFNLYRADGAAGPWAQLNPALIPAAAPGSSQAQVYSWLDDTVLAGMTYWYMLEDVGLDGTATQHEPVEVTVAAPTAVSMSGFGAAGPAAWPALAGLAALLGVAAAGIARRRK